MYFPHTVTLYNITQDKTGPNITVLRGVFFDAAKASNVRTSGLEGADSVNLYIPFNVDATDGISLFKKNYVGEKEYEKAADKTDIWTLFAGAGANSACFFVKGEVVEPDKNYQYINGNYDDVYKVTKVDEKDFGTQDMRHWEVGGA